LQEDKNPKVTIALKTLSQCLRNLLLQLDITIDGVFE
jgi:hypothetical protein